MKLLIATTNLGKLHEIKTFLQDVPIELVSLTDSGITETVEEAGKTFEENAILKAKFYFEKSGLPTLADDGGFEIDALNGEPGVRSHRWVDSTLESTDEELIEYTMKRMETIPIEKRKAQLCLVLALVLPNREVITIEEKVRGIIPLEPSKNRTPGFPYRALLFLPEINKYYDYTELTEEETEEYNHRKRAVERLKPVIREKLISPSLRTK